MSQSQSVESATTALSPRSGFATPLSGMVTPNGTHIAAPDSKTRRYDRQLRLWASSGQSALESAHILLLSSSATSTSILKNLVLPGIGAFTILDEALVSPADAGNNFFLDGQHSIGKKRAQEAVRLLGELNDDVNGHWDTRRLDDVLRTEGGREWIKGFTIVVAHNLEPIILDKLAGLLWDDETAPPLLVVRSAGFLAEFFIQFHEHNVVESHSESTPSLRIDKPFPALLDHAMSLDFTKMDSEEHAHIPYVVILVRALEDWKKSHNGQPPKTYPEKQEFKKGILAMKTKQDEENFDEAEGQAYRAWTESTVPSDIRALFPSGPPTSLHTPHSSFYHLLNALSKFTSLPPYTLPLTSTLPDMRSNTANYIHLQKLYKTRAEEEKTAFKEILSKGGRGAGVGDEEIDSFVRNCHALRVLKGKRWGAFDAVPEALASALQSSPNETSTHLALSALAALHIQSHSQPTANISEQLLLAEVQRKVGPSVELGEIEELRAAVGEIIRAPTADLPNVAGFLGGLVAQESIKMITKQYVPVNGYCIVDLVETRTGVIGG